MAVCRLSAALSGERIGPFYEAAVKGLAASNAQAVQICACRAIYALTPKAGPGVLQPVMNPLYEGGPASGIPDICSSCESRMLVLGRTLLCPEQKKHPILNINAINTLMACLAICCGPRPPATLRSLLIWPMCSRRSV